jgi:hypothetical protein
MEFTEEQQQHINQLIADEKAKWTKEVLEPVQQQVEKFKPLEKSDAEIALEQKQLELFEKEKILILKEKGLAEFGEFFNVQKIEDLDGQIEKFNNVLKEKKVDTSFKPNNHKQQTDKYSQFEKEGNTVGMIGTKLTNLFK